MRLLIVVGEPKMAVVMKQALDSEGYQSVITHSGEEAFYRLSTEPFDLMLLDLLLQKRGGLEILKVVRDTGYTLPIFILTDRDTAEDRMLGFENGAHEYLTKPISLQELSSRIRLRLDPAHRGAVGSIC